MHWEPLDVRPAASAAVIVLLLSAVAFAQAVSIRGTIEGYPCGGGLNVELNNRTNATSARAEVMPDGTFELLFLEPGSYELLVLDFRQHVLHREPVSVKGESARLLIRLHLPKPEQPISETISAQALSRKTPDAAVKEGNKSLKAIEKGDLENAVVHLRKAIDIYPDFPAAHNNLGVCYARLDQRDAALSEFQRAAELDSGSAGYALNLSTELLFHNNYSEAEWAARHALRLDPSSEQAHYVLGSTLAAQRRASGEALRQLDLAVTRIPEALIVAADVLARMGRRAEAAARLRKYLDLPGNSKARAVAASWLKALE